MDWHRLVKILEGQTKIWGENVVRTDKCTVVSQILGARLGSPHKSTPMHTCFIQCPLSLINIRCMHCECKTISKLLFPALANSILELGSKFLWIKTSYETGRM